ERGRDVRAGRSRTECGIVSTSRGAHLLWWRRSPRNGRRFLGALRSGEERRGNAHRPDAGKRLLMRPGVLRLLARAAGALPCLLLLLGPVGARSEPAIKDSTWV